ncbi:MAG: Hsp20/alpha crystallin family protein [bacterium]|nr:Hsp20/alpha crystallin family protein [bacterium]
MTPKWFSRSKNNQVPAATAPAEPNDIQQDDWLADFEGQLAVDAYETDDSLIIKAPVAGVDKKNLDIQITDTSVTIRGTREDNHQLDAEGFYLQECYWGSFSRSFELPFPVESKKAQASLKNGLLTIVLPKSENARTTKLEIAGDE